MTLIYLLRVWVRLKETSNVFQKMRKRTSAVRLQRRRALPCVSRQSNMIGRFRSPLIRWVLVLREVWLQVVPWAVCVSSSLYPHFRNFDSVIPVDVIRVITNKYLFFCSLFRLSSLRLPPLSLSTLVLFKYYTKISFRNNFRGPK